MKKKIVSMILLGMYFLGGFGVGFADSLWEPYNPNAPDIPNQLPRSNTTVDGTNGNPLIPATTTNTQSPVSGNPTDSSFVGPPAITSVVTNNTSGTPNDGSIQTNYSNNTSSRKNTDGSTTTFDANGELTSHTAPDGTKTTWNTDNPSSPTSSVSNWGPNDMTSTDFRLNPNDLSPSEKKYTSGTRTNFKTLLANIGKYLLIATTTIAVLSIVVWGLMISTTGPTDRAAKGKTIIILNITAIIVALFSYSIIRLVSWLIA